MSYTATTTIKSIAVKPKTTEDKLRDKITELRQTIAKMRTEIGHKNNDLQQAYQEKANKELAQIVAAEKAHLQAQVDAIVKQATKHEKEAEHWRGQVEIIYSLLEDTTAKAEAEIARLSQEVAQLKRELARKPAQKKKPKWRVEE